LLHAHGAGKRAFSRALETVFGWVDGASQVRFAGATDQLIFRQLCQERAHTPSPDEEAAFFRQLPLELMEPVTATRHTLFPGVRELLDQVHAREDCLLGLVTGNIEPCAVIKPRCFDLEGFFRFGGFGSDHPDRAVIARIALDRALHHLPPDAEVVRVLLVGDALSDMQAARAVGATAIGVTTGSHEAEELTKAGAHHVVDSLLATERMLELMGLA